jgi:hypothetical protein
MNPFRKTKEVLKGGRRWTKGAYHAYGNETPEGDVFCLMGALTEATAREGVIEDSSERRILTSIICEQYPPLKDYDVTCAVEDWNDFPETTWVDVERVLDKAAVKFDEQVDNRGIVVCQNRWGS